MMDALRVLFVAVVGYLCGSISFARIVTRIFAPQEDITRTELQSPGSDEIVMASFVSATTVSMHLGTRLGFLTVVLDMLKLVIPTVVFRLVWEGEPYFLLTSVMGMVGHIWPVYYGFQGGRGLSAVYGAMFAIDWIGVFATSIGGLLLGLFVFRDVLVAYMGGLWLLIPWLWFRTHDLWHLAYAIAVNVIFGVAMIPEMTQYLKLKREGKGADLSQAMQTTGMGRGIYKMARRFGAIRDTPRQDSQEVEGAQ